MKAIIVQDDQSLAWQETADVSPGDNEVLIDVHATALNRADLMQRRGLYPPPPGASPVMGLECAGEVIAVGSGVKKFSPGDAVCALLAGGGYAERCVADEGSVLPLPAGFSFDEGACLPEVFATAWLNLFMEAGLRPGEKVILHAGASGVGTAGIQLCRAFGNLSFVTAGSASKIETCTELGAAGGANRHDGSFVAAAREFAGEAGVDVILDPVGGAYLADNLDLLGMNGRLVLIGLMGGAQVDINLALLMMKRLRLVGSTLRARPLAEKAAVMAQLGERVWPKLESGDIKPILDRKFDINEAAAAHDLLATDETVGKVVLSVPH